MMLLSDNKEKSLEAYNELLNLVDPAMKNNFVKSNTINTINNYMAFAKLVQSFNLNLKPLYFCGSNIKTTYIEPYFVCQLSVCDDNYMKWLEIDFSLKETIYLKYSEKNVNEFGFSGRILNFIKLHNNSFLSEDIETIRKYLLHFVSDKNECLFFEDEKRMSSILNLKHYF